MKREEFNEASEDYERIERAIRFIEANFRRQPTLDDIAAAIHLSKFHFHRLFKRWAGVTPQQFLHFLTIEHAKEMLRQSRSILDASLAAGLSSGSRLHDLFVSFEAVTPGEYKQHGEGLVITYGYHPTPFGGCLLAMTRRGICALRFCAAGERDECLRQLQQQWPAASFVEDVSVTLPVVTAIFKAKGRDDMTFHLALKGTNFQMQVWRALLAIPPGRLVSYQDIAESIGKPTAVRAVAHAIADNPVAYLIPCHRVIRKTGEIHNYRWGTARKKALIGWEAGRLEGESG